MTNEQRSAEAIKEQVRRSYGRRAARILEPQPQTSCCSPAQESACCAPRLESPCCGPAQETPCCDAGAATEDCCSSAPSQKGAPGAAQRLYTDSQVGDLPESVTGASAGCGNPTAIAGLRPGEVVLDLGSGGGIDCFLAAKKVGPVGRVIGLDMTTEMIRLARRNAKKMGVTNVDFRYGEMEEMPLPDASVDVILSNCVINLSPDKDAVFAEAFRVLKPGGRMSVSDMVLEGELPEPLLRSADAWSCCVGGALDEGVYLAKMRAAGLTDVEVTQRTYIDVSGWLSEDDIQALLGQGNGPATREKLGQELQSKVASITVTARKPS